MPACVTFVIHLSVYVVDKVACQLVKCQKENITFSLVQKAEIFNKLALGHYISTISEYGIGESTVCDMRNVNL